jgi:hypothetical protein
VFHNDRITQSVVGEALAPSVKLAVAWLCKDGKKGKRGMSSTDPRPITPLDLPLVRRVIAQQLPLDMAAALTRGVPGIEDVLLSSVPLADLGAPTVILRHGDDGYVGQFRQRADKAVAQLTFLAPEPQVDEVHDWSYLLEAITFEAGKRGAHLISAEIPEHHPAFQAFRLAGFAVFSRQVILRRDPAVINGSGSDPALLRPVIDQDAFGINVLYGNTVPRLLQQAEPLADGGECDGLIYERDGQIAGYLAVIEGRNGIVIKPYFHPEVYEQAPTIILSALSYTPHVDRLPVYLYARAYQDWLRGALDEVEFRPWAHQALMVKYTLVRVGRGETLPLEAAPLRPPVADGPIPLHKFDLLKSRLPLWRRNGKIKANQ